jgi:glutaredoxin 3
MPEPHISLYISRWCTQCERAAALLERHGIPFETVDVADLGGCCRLHELTGGASVPQAVVDGRPIGGYDDLAALVRVGFPGPADPRPGRSNRSSTRAGTTP